MPRVSVPCPDSPAWSGAPRCLLQGGTSWSPHIPFRGKPSGGQRFPGGSVGWAGSASRPAPPMAEQSEGRPWRRSPGRAHKRPSGAVGRDEAMQAGCQPPGRVCRAVISAHTRTLRAARWELVRSGLLIASPTAPARGDAASQALLREAGGMGARGLGHPGPAPRLAQAPIATAPLLADVLGVRHGERRAQLTSRPALSCNLAPDLRGTLPLAFTQSDMRPGRCPCPTRGRLPADPRLCELQPCSPLAAWGKASGHRCPTHVVGTGRRDSGLCDSHRSPCPFSRRGAGRGDPRHAAPAARAGGGAPSGQGRPATPPSGAVPGTGAWLGRQESQWKAAAVNINIGRANRGAAMLLTA